MSSKIISKKEIEKIAELSRLALTEEEKDLFANDLSNILEYFQDLSKADTKNVNSVDVREIKENQLRVDEVQKEDVHVKGQICNLFPQCNGNYLKVKKVL